MTQARKNQINLDSTPYYHCVTRCVRQAYLCGKDLVSGKSYDHRKLWLRDRLAVLKKAFAINIADFSVMSNHYHLVLHVDQIRAAAWSVEEVINRWLLIFRGPALIQRFHRKESLTDAELEQVHAIAEGYRKRLFSISEFMARLNQHVACKANLEDGCKGKFWEKRFYSQALLDDGALLTCMIYVNLNPIRAGLCDTLEGSDFTSVQQRLYAYARSEAEKKSGEKWSKVKNGKRYSYNKPPADNDEHEAPELQSFLDSQLCGETAEESTPLPFKLTDYFELIDFAGRAIRSDKKGAIPESVMPVLEKLRLNPEAIVETIEFYKKRFKLAVGSIEKLKQFATDVNKQWLFGHKSSRVLYSE